MGFLLAGLLQGAGQGITNLATQRREDALSALKRQQTLSDQADADKQELAKEDRAGVLKLGLLQYAELAKKDENETEFQHQQRLKVLENDLTSGRDAKKYTYDRALAAQKTLLDLNHDIASKGISAQIDAGMVDSIHAAEDGSTVVVYKDGRTVVNKSVKLRAPGDGGGDGADSVKAMMDRKNGVKPPIASTPAAGPKGVASATAGGKTMTQAQINSTAKLRGQTPAEVQQVMEELGYRLVG